MTHTYAILQVSKSTFEEISKKLKAVKYDHAFDEDDGKVTIDMHGIALQEAP